MKNEFWEAGEGENRTVVNLSFVASVSYVRDGDHHVIIITMAGNALNKGTMLRVKFNSKEVCLRHMKRLQNKLQPSNPY